MCNHYLPRVLDLSYNQIESLSTFQSELPKLVKLSLKKNKMKSLINISNFPALTYLKLSRNNLENLSELSRLSKLKSLKGISLYKNPLEEDKTLYVQTVLAACPYLESLDHNNIADVKKGSVVPPANNSHEVSDGFMFKPDRDDRSEKLERPGSGKPRVGSSGAERNPSEGISNNNSKHSEIRPTSANLVRKDPSPSDHGNAFKNTKLTLSKGMGAGGSVSQKVRPLQPPQPQNSNKNERSDQKEYEEGGDDDDEPERDSPPADGDDIFSMNPKSLSTIKLAWEKKLKERPGLLTSGGKKDEEIWLGSAGYPIGYFKKIGTNNYKVVGDGLWMLMASKATSIKAVEEVDIL